MRIVWELRVFLVVEMYFFVLMRISAGLYFKKIGGLKWTCVMVYKKFYLYMSLYYSFNYLIKKKFNKVLCVL